MGDTVNFEGKVALITGGSRGIGKAIALALAKHGADVVVVSRTEADVTAAADDIAQHGIRARGYACDVSSFEDVQTVGRAVLEEFDKVDYLVNNAGVTHDALLLRMRPEDWQRVLSINLTGSYNFTKVLSPHFLKQRSGRIINMTSVVGLTGNAGQASYAASKAGIIGLTRSLAKEFASRGVTVNAVAPGYIKTDMTDALSEAQQSKILEAIPLGRFGTVEDVAGIVLFLLSDLAEYVTGQVINCDGGMVMS